MGSRSWRQGIAQQLRWLALAAVAVVAIGFGAGWLFGQSNTPAASRTLLGPRVATEPQVTATSTPGELPADFAAAPTSGAGAGDPVCGLHDEPVAAADQVATLETGAVIVQYRPADLGGAVPDALRDLVGAHPSHVLVAPNPAIDDPVVVTAWRNRMRLSEVDAELLDAFVTGYRRPQGSPASCATR